MVLERGADLHMAQLMPLPLTVCCFSIIQIGFTFLISAHPGSPGQRAVKRVCVCVCVVLCMQATVSLKESDYFKVRVPNAIQPQKQTVLAPVEVGQCAVF